MDDVKNGQLKTQVVLMSKVDLEEPIPIIDQIYLGCTQRESETNKGFVTEKSELLNKLVSSSTNSTKFNHDTKHNVITWSNEVQLMHKSELNAVAN